MAVPDASAQRADASFFFLPQGAAKKEPEQKNIFAPAGPPSCAHLLRLRRLNFSEYGQLIRCPDKLPIWDPV